MKTNVIKQSLANQQQGSEGVDAPRLLPATLRDDDEAQFIRIFDEAMTATQEKAEVIAFELGTTYQKVSDYRTGKRTIAGHRLLRLGRKNHAAGVSIVRALAKLFGGMRVTEIGKVGKDDLRRQLVMSLERNPAILRVALADAAQALGVDEAEAAQVWDGPTQEIKVG
jgi:hypothetical protein